MATYDYIIVGAGTAGCVLANRLSDNGKHSVLLIEAGPKDRYHWIHIPVGYAKTMFNEKYNWCFYTQPDPEMNNRRIYWPRGKVLGGSSSINGLIYVRGQPLDYNLWAQEGNRGWGWDDVLPYFRKLEGNERGESEFHGGDGPLKCSDIHERHELMEAIIRAGNEQGVKTTDDFNGPNQEGVGYYQLFTHNGFRCSTAVGYLKPARDRANLRVETGAMAKRIVFDGKKATGIEYVQNGETKVAHVGRELVLSAGALHSPMLLERSGVGQSELLRSMGIEMVHELKAVGENMQDHLQFRLQFRCKKPITSNDKLNSFWGRIGIGAEYILRRTGPMAVGINHAGMFTQVLKESAGPDIQFHFSALTASLAAGKPDKFPGFTFSVCQLRPTSRGSVHISSRALDGEPIIHPRYLTTDLDWRCSLEGVKFALRLADSPALADYKEANYQPGPGVDSDEQIVEWMRDAGATIFHPSCTTRMGSDDNSVVDARLRVHGLANVRVADCGIMPNLVSGNTNAPVVMIGEKASDMILEDAAL